MGRPRFSKLLVDVEDAEDGDDESQQSDTRLRHTVRELCKTIDAFIYVVDASADSQRGNNIVTAISSWISKNITAKIIYEPLPSSSFLFSKTISNIANKT